MVCALFQEHYCDLKNKPFFPSLIEYMESGPVVPMVWEGLDAVKQGRQMLGTTNPLQSLPGSIRGDFRCVCEHTAILFTPIVAAFKRAATSCTAVTPSTRRSVRLRTGSSRKNR